MPRVPRLLPALVLVLAACDQGPATVTPYMHPAGSFDFLIAATRGGGPLYLEIDGDPFGSGEDLEGRVIAAMEPALQSRVLSLTTDQAAAEDAAFRLVLVFDPAGGSGGDGELFEFCASQPSSQPAGGTVDLDEAASTERIELRAGFCRGDDLLAAVDGWVEDASGADDARFQQLLQQVVRDLFVRSRKDD